MNTRHPYWPDLTDKEGDILSAYFDATCGDCRTGRCHGGFECLCNRHAASVDARQFEAVGREAGDRWLIATAKAWYRARCEEER